MIGEIAHFLSLAAVLLFSLVLIFNLLFFFNKIHPNELTLSMRLFSRGRLDSRGTFYAHPETRRG